MRNFILFISILHGIVFYAQGQASRIYDNRDYGVGELSSNLVNSISQDKQGYVWIATEYGLNKFDGIRFTQYLHDTIDSTSISSNNVTVLYTDHKKTLWVGCNNGLQIWEEHLEKFSRIHFPNKIAPHITSVLQCSSGEIWVATSGWGVFAIDVNKKEATSLGHINQIAGGMYARKLFEDTHKHIWIAVDHIGVVKLSADGRRSEAIKVANMPQPRGGNFQIVQWTPEEYIFSSSSAIVVYHTKTKTIRPIEFKGGISSIISDIQCLHDGSVMIATEGEGVWKLTKPSQPFLAIPADLQNLDSDYRNGRIRTFFEDREHNLWLGWFQRGLVFIPNSSNEFEFWRLLDTQETDRKTVNAICKDGDGKVWYAIQNQGVYQVDADGRVINRFESLQDVTQLLWDGNGNIWYSSFSNGLGVISSKTGKAAIVKQFPLHQIKHMALGANRKLYLSSFGNGFYEYDIELGDFRHFSMKNVSVGNGALDNDWINMIVCDKDGLVWLGHFKGISCYDPRANMFIPAYHPSALAEQIAISLALDKEENLWVGTYNGLYKFDRHGSTNVSTYTIHDGLSSNVIAGLVVDDKGTIWCSSLKGINRLDPKSKKVVNYYTGDGLVDKSYNRGVYFQDGQGKIYFGGKQGITAFYPRAKQSERYNQHIYITNLYLRNQLVKLGEPSGGQIVYQNGLAENNQFYFSNNDDSFTIELSTMDYNSPENVHYEYRIKGVSRSWNATLPGVNLITYNNLAPGSHELEIRACKFGAFSDIKMITLHVLPPWYRSNIAYGVYLLAAIGLLTLILKYLRERRLEKIHAYKLQLFTDISHEIRTPLTLVISPLDKLIQHAADGNVRQTLETMKKNAGRILKLVNQLLDVRKLESGHMKPNFVQTDLVKFLNRCMEPFAYRALERGIDCQFLHEEASVEALIDQNSFDKVITNLLSNAFKFTPDGGRIRVMVTGITGSGKGAKSSQIEISVVDSGPGIPEADRGNIFKRFYQSNNQMNATDKGTGIGLHICKALVEMHGGKISAENGTQEPGTKFIVRIPQGILDEKKNRHLSETELDKPSTVISSLPQGIADPQSRNNQKQPSGYKVLLVDDDKDILEYLTNELGAVYKVLAADNGSEALQLALSQSPDLIISDVAMPEMDGFTLVKKLKQNSATNHIPIVLLTAKAEMEDRLHGIGTGADAYLTKPFRSDELLLLSKNLIKNRMTVKGKFSGAQQQDGKVKTISFKSSDELLMERIVNTVNKFLEDPNLNVQLLADEVGLSRVQLHRKVKALTGISTSEFIRNIRLKQAEQLLLEKRMNISQVAYALGFTNQTHFSTLFKKMYGLSPSDYISRHIQQ